MDTRKAVRAFLDSRRARGLSLNTVRWYEGILNAFATRFPKLPRKPEQVEDFLLHCKAGDERRHGYYRALRCFYRFLNRRLKVVNPIDLIDPPKRKPKRPRSLMPDELDQLLAYPHPRKIKASLLFLVDTGARIGELAGLTLNNLSETPWGYIARITGKTGTRLVPISTETYQALNTNLPFNCSPYRLRRLIAQAFINAHVKGSAHILRHTFGTLWAGDELALQQIMGHAHLSTTKIYRHLRTESLAEQHRKHSPLNMIYGFTRRLGF